MDFAKWLMSPQAIALNMTDREMLIAQLAWTQASIATFDRTIERLLPAKVAA